MADQHEHVWGEAELVDAPDSYMHELGRVFTLCIQCGAFKKEEHNE